MPWQGAKEREASIAERERAAQRSADAAGAWHAKHAVEEGRLARLAAEAEKRQAEAQAAAEAAAQHKSAAEALKKACGRGWI